MEDHRSDIAALESLRWGALLDGDTAALEQLMHDDLAYTHSNGLVDTRTEFLTRLTSGQLRYADIETSDQSIRIHADTTVVTGHAVLTTGSTESRLITPIRYTAVWARTSDGWRHVAWHSSPATV
ncbi:nuclear transport factor 2 family protein [Nocardioides alcanivorans]|uniref:nuclear transport factor 2 family protein n=1 Tax=Nocardioides alcanivorans TaxID=2897352 RepID=UPI001F35F457|nr:nuclear transport factor 2 family protein [Nocardioides alcanivorans]